MSEEKDILEVHMAHMRDSLHDIRDHLGSFQSVAMDVHTLKENTKSLPTLVEKVQKNELRINTINTKTNVITGIFSGIFTMIIGILSLFKK